MVVQVPRQSLDAIGAMLPALRQLTLDSSALASFRDLGTGLTALQSLSVAHCGLRDLDGVDLCAALEHGVDAERCLVA